MKKVFTSLLFFIFVFTTVSIVADAYYHNRLSRSESGKNGWLCWCDFRVFWTAGHAVRNYASIVPQTDDTYPKGLEYHKDLKKFIGNGRDLVYNKAERFYHFRYTPFAVFLMIPFSLIPYPATALMAWYFLLNAALLTSLLLLTRQMALDFKLSRPAQYAILWGTFVLSLKFYLMNLSVGQSDVLIALFFVLFLMAYIRGREVLCGILLALILQFKPLFFPITLYFLVSGKVKIAISAILSFLALLVAPAAIIGFEKTLSLVRDWLEIFRMSVSSQVLIDKNQSLTYFVGKNLLSINTVKSHLPPDRLFYMLSAAFKMCSYIGLLLFARLSRVSAEDKKFKYLELSLLIMITLLFSPLVWVAHFINLIIPISVAVLFLSKKPGSRLVYFAAALFIILSVVAGTDLVNYKHIFDRHRFINIALGTVFLAYVIVASYKAQVEK